MEFLDKNTIKLDKVESNLDLFTLEFTKILSKYTDYVIVSGYVAILFGRNRASEDIDIFIPKIAETKIKLLAEYLVKNGFWVVNDDPESVYSMLVDVIPPRFAKSGRVEPNAELKFAKKDLDFYSLDNKIKVVLRSGEVFISPIELNIAYKLFLSSDKDIEDARFLFRMFKDKLDMELLNNLVDRLKVRNLFEKYIVV